MSFLAKYLQFTINYFANYDLQTFVFVTLFLQSLLVLAAPFRKRTANRLLMCLVWLAYLISDWASNFAVGLFPSTKDSTENNVGSDILMLWAPFLMLHMGGADSISALTSTNNELWSRFAIQLATMIYGIGNVFYRSFTESRLRVLILLMFVAGFTRYLERILSLTQARLSSLRDTLIQKRSGSSKTTSLVLEEEEVGEERNSYELSDAKMLGHAYHLFESFKVIFADLHVDSKDWRISREYFFSRNPRDAFRIVEIEMNYSYDMFYSKVPMICKWQGQFLRLVCVVCEVTTLFLWFHMDKKNFKHFDVSGTYALLVGAVARDFISLLMMIFSDWTIARIAKKSDDSKLINNWLSLRKQRWDKYLKPMEAPLSILLLRALLRRWSESVSQLNFIDQCLKFDRESDLFAEDTWEDLGCDLALYKLRNVEKKWFTNDLKDFIFQELKDKTFDDMEISRGQWTLGNYMPRSEELSRLSNIWIVDKTFDESILLWHIATTLCYHTEDDLESMQEDQLLEKQCCKLGKVLSDYMLFLLLQRPNMMLEVAAMGDMRYEDTLSKAKTFLHSFFDQCNEDGGDYRRLGCEELLREQISEHEDEGYSVLIDACRLARKLKELKERQLIQIWELIAKVWVEMLSYGAIHCKPSAHVAELANGGELLTLVWFLMEHLGFAKAR